MAGENLAFIMERVCVEDRGFSSPCWTWQRCLTEQGYAKASVPGFGRVGVHRASYEIHVGPIPEGLVIDHLCRVPACVNPDHLEPVTHAENVRRGLRGRPQTHCLRGHELTDENLIVWKGKRRCRACNVAWRIANDAQPARARSLRQKKRLREAAAARIIGTGGVAPDGQRPRLAQGHTAHDKAGK